MIVIIKAETVSENIENGYYSTIQTPYPWSKSEYVEEIKKNIKKW